MRIIRDVVADVTKDGQVIHSGVRVMLDDQRRLAVFEGKSKNPPVAVYADGEVQFTVTGSCSACKGYPPRMSMVRIWEQAERQAASA